MICKIITWNVNGLNSPNKHRLIMHSIGKQKVDVVCLQEILAKK